MFLIEDELHDELQGKYASYDDALAELRRRALIAWDQAPNVAPCTSWKTCGRSYEIVEYDEAQRSAKELRRVEVLRIDAEGVRWAEGFES